MVGSGVILLDYWLYSQSSVVMEAWAVTELSYTLIWIESPRCYHPTVLSQCSQNTPVTMAG